MSLRAKIILTQINVLYPQWDQNMLRIADSPVDSIRQFLCNNSTSTILHVTIQNLGGGINWGQNALVPRCSNSFTKNNDLWLVPKYAQLKKQSVIVTMTVPNFWDCVDKPEVHDLQTSWFRTTLFLVPTEKITASEHKNGGQKSTVCYKICFSWHV